MGTRSTIALANQDGTISEIYCHWDGYLENNGKILMESYGDVSRILELISHGNMSELDSDIDSCVFYGRDRGETEVSATSYSNFDDYLKNHNSQEFDYLYRDNQWLVKFHGNEFMPLSEAMLQESTV